MEFEVMPRSKIVAPTSIDPPGSGQWLSRIQSTELLFVRRCASTNSTACFLARLGSKLGNGWVYPLLAAFLLWPGGRLMPVAIIVGAASAAMLHCVYPLIKVRAARLRPFVADPTLRSLILPLDHYSFPSGHLMTLTAVAIPIGIGAPPAALPLVGVWLFISWSRIVCAHHYPSDILAGTLLSVSVSTPLALWFVK